MYTHIYKLKYAHIHIYTKRQLHTNTNSYTHIIYKNIYKLTYMYTLFL